MSALLIGPDEKAMIKHAMETARATPIPFAVLKAKAMEIPKDPRRVVTATESEAARKNRPQSIQVIIPIMYRLAISFEEQPVGLCAHLSISLDVPGRMPHPLAVQMILQEAGFNIDPMNPPREVGWWIEEYLIDGKPSGKALNFLFTVEKAKEAATQ